MDILPRPAGMGGPTLRDDGPDAITEAYAEANRDKPIILVGEERDFINELKELAQKYADNDCFGPCGIEISVFFSNDREVYVDVTPDDRKRG